MKGLAMHPCTHCAVRPREQDAFDAWATEQFKGRLSLPGLAARITRETTLMTEFAIAGDTDLVLDQLAFVVALAYRVAGACEADLWEQVGLKVAELQTTPEHEERF
jgi:hypothetical protein